MEDPDSRGNESDDTDIGSTTRRGLLVGLTTGAGALGLGAAATARGPPDAAGNDGRTGQRDAAGNDERVGPDENRGPPDQVIVGAATQAAADEAAQRATEVRHRLDFGDHGKAVAGRFPEQAREGLRNRPDVDYVEPDGTFEAIGESLPWGVDRVDANVVHDDGTTGDGADIAIIDTGIDSDHPDLEANLGAGKAYVEAGTSADGSDCSGNGNTLHEPWDDDSDHGTHCAGTAAAVANDSGVIGAAPGATLHAVKVLGCDGVGYLSDIAAGVEYTADQGWDVASLSLGSSSDYSTLKNACQYAVDEGVLVVAAAGNDGPCTDCVSYPAKYDSTVAVSATDSSDDLASFSSTGPEIDIAAPGSSILSTVPGGTAYFSGTSMACPHVSGAGGLLMANGASGSEARSALADSAEDIGLSSSDGGNGLLDAEGAASSSSSPSIGETGRLETNQSGSDEWHQVSLDGSYTDPVVIMDPLSYDGGHPSHVRLRNVAGDGFEFKIEEWKYLDGWHTSETMHYVVVEAGTYELADGTLVEAGTTSTGTSFTEVQFGQAFGSTPVVLSQAQTFDGNHPIVTRNRNLSTGGFEVKVQEEEAEGWHATESVGYLAVESGAGSNDGTAYEVNTTANAVTHDWHTISFEQSYDDPLFVAGMQTTDGWQPAGVRYRNLTADSVEVFVEEERSDDDEMAHADEVIGYAVFDGSGSVSGT
jgi:subtilisin